MKTFQIGGSHPEENKFAKVSKSENNTEKDIEFITALELLIDDYRKD